jgi:hypothetical protein
MRKQGRWVTTIHHLEWCGANGCLERSVAAVLRKWQPVKPAPWLVPCEAAEVDTKNYVRHFRLTVGLWVEGSAHSQLNASQTKQLLPEGAGEDGVMVADNGARDDVQLDDVVEEGFGDGHSGVWVAQRNEVDVHGEAVHHCEHHHLATDAMESLNEIDGDVSPYCAGDLRGCSIPARCLCSDLLRWHTAQLLTKSLISCVAFGL